MRVPGHKDNKNSHLKDNMKIVYVLNQDGSKLMPCKPTKARHLLKSNRAKVINRSPFTIQLSWQCEGFTQEVVVGIDKGSHETGYCAVGNNKILLCGVIHHRKDIKEKMDSRREHRRSRRNRKWYRKPRFLNRASSRRSGRIPPSTKANVEEVYRVINKLPLPISHIVIEDVQIDIAALNNPDLNGKAYQESNRLHPNLRLACLIRDDFQCKVCNKKNIKLEAHHIVERNKGGKDTIKNLVTLCDKCHDKLHKGKVTLALEGENGFKDKIAQRTMQGKAHLYGLLNIIAPVEKRFGYETHDYRKILGLQKDHHIDAQCLATISDGKIVDSDKSNYFDINFFPSQTRKQYYSCSKKGKGRVKYQVNEKLEGFRKGDIVLVKGRWEKRINSIYSTGYLAFPRVKGEPFSSTPKHCRLLEKSKTVMFG